MWLYIKFGQAGTACVGAGNRHKGCSEKVGSVEIPLARPSREAEMTLALLSNQAWWGRGKAGCRRPTRTTCQRCDKMAVVLVNYIKAHMAHEDSI